MQKLKRLVTVGVLSVGIVAGAIGMTGIAGDVSASNHAQWRSEALILNWRHDKFALSAIGMTAHHHPQPIETALHVRKAGGDPLD
jgi:hypothetical protein